MLLPGAGFIGLVSNSRARGRPVRDDLVARLAGLGPVRVFEVTEQHGPTACARTALDAGASLIVAAGGDGTVSGVAAALVGTPCPLGILPCGTANSIARALGVPVDLDEAAGLLKDRAPVRVDTALANGLFMMLLASVGLHAVAVAEAPAEQKRRWGPLAYVATGLRKVSDTPLFRLIVETPAERFACEATMVTIANLAPVRAITAQGPAVVAPDDGLLDATIVASDSVLGAVTTGLHLLRTALEGSPADREGVGFLSATRLRITADPPQPVLVDGEAAGTTPLDVEIRPASLLVMAAPPPHPPKRPERQLEGLPGLTVG